MTIFTAVAWIREEAQSYVVISDELHHDKKAVTTFLTAIVKDLEKKHPAMRELHVFSDGAASQFKNRYIWFFLSTTLKETFPDVSTEWHYFATSHGKGAVDGVGGTVKRAVGTAVLSRQGMLINFGTFAETARRVCPKMEVFLINKDDISEFCKSHDIEKYWELVAPLPGTLNVHSVVLVSWGQVQYRSYSSATESAIHVLVQSPDSADSSNSSDDEPEAHP